MLISAGPDFASADSLFRSPLGEIVPGAPTARVLEEPFQPVITDLGDRHPVTAGLTGEESWGRWLRQIEVEPEGAGNVLMSGIGERPLLVLDRVGEGRIALMASDQAWLWSRGYEGGGPQLELLRRLAHWMMKEPELEEETLFAEASGQTMRIIRRTLEDGIGPVTVTRPDGETEEISLEEVAPGRFEALYDGPEIGLYRLSEGEQEAVIGLGPSAPREFEETIATADIMAPAIDAMRGGALRLEDGLPASARLVRDVRRPGAAGSGSRPGTPTKR